MTSSVVLRRGSDESVVIPDERVQPGWEARAVLRQYPDGPVLETWSSRDGSAVVEAGQVVLLCDRLSGASWSSGEVDVHLRAPDSTRIVVGPVRVRLR